VTRNPNSAGEGTGALEKALDVLDAVGGAPGGLSQGEITERLALPRTTTYRLLATLVARGLLRRDPLRKVYCLGLRCLELARQAHASPDLVAAAAGELRGLRDLTGETVDVATLDGLDVVSLGHCDSAHGDHTAAALGPRKPLYCTSQGKAILAALPAEARDALVRDLALKPLTPHTLTHRHRLQAELRITAARGWSIDEEESVAGVRCVGAAVVDAQGAVRGALSVAGPAWRLTRERAELLGPEVAQAARRTGDRLRAGAPVTGDPAVQTMEGPWAFHGAFPRWCPDSRRLYWCDTLAPALRVFDGGRDHELARVEAPITGLVVHGDELLLAHEAGVLRVTPDGESAPLTTWPPGRLLAVCGGNGGGLWAAFAAGANGCVVGQVQPGGAFSAQWHLDEPVQALACHPGADELVATVPASGSLLRLLPGSARVRRQAVLPAGSGRVSGLAVDAEGGAWTALREGWSVVRLTPDGELDRIVGLPVPHPTDVAVVGAGLFVTTARQPVALDVLATAPSSGRLLAVSLQG
jgi:DNA-binding IclR family transcriptional regulator